MRRHFASSVEYGLRADHRNKVVFGVFLLLVLAGACFGSQVVRDRASTTQTSATQPRVPELGLPEDELGVVGAPLDETSFDFEPEVEDDAPSALEVDGVPEVPQELVASLAPFLEARRARLQSAASDGSWMLVISRIEQTAQAYRVTKPGGDLQRITAGRDPVVQISTVPGVRSTWLYRSDEDGTEDYQILRIGADRKPVRLTDGTAKNGSFLWSPSGSWFAFSSNSRTGANMDIYRSTPSPDSQPELVRAVEGSWSVSAWAPDETALLAREYESFAVSRMHLIPVGDGEATTLSEPDTAFLRGRFLTQDNLLLTSNRGQDFVHLYRYELASGKWTNLTPDLAWDVEELAVGDGKAAFTVNEDGLSRLHVLDLDSGDTSHLQQIPRGIVRDLRYLKMAGKLAFTLDRPTSTGDVFSIAESGEGLQRWTDSSSSSLDASTFVEPSAIRVTSFDGVEVPAWLYRPTSEGPHPVLLWVHGGPEDQHRPAFNPIIQFFVSVLGVAVIAPNIRGSDGYGRTYVSLDDGRKREDSVKDIGAILDWIEADEVLDAGRVGIYGASYGGYVVLAALGRFGDRLAAGCDMVGISNFVTFLENTRDYRRDQRRAEYGDESDPEMREFLEAISPTNYADSITSPLFVVHGANDPRVPLGEARQIVDAVRQNGTEAWLMVAHDEGHGFHKRRNRDAFYAAMAEFFRTHLL